MNNRGQIIQLPPELPPVLPPHVRINDIRQMKNYFKYIMCPVLGKKKRTS